MGSKSSRPAVLVLGATGQLGGLLAKELRDQEAITLKVSSRNKELLPTLKEQFGDAAYLDLTDPRTFPEARQGVDGLFLLTGYSVDMLVQSKAMTDAAKKAGVSHIVHLGVF